MSKRIYLVSEKQTNQAINPARLVNASTPAQAVRHVVKDLFDVKVAEQTDIVRQLTAGIKVEEASAEEAS